MTHLLVTNDFPPKVGGIQSYLYDLWRRCDPDRFVVVTHADPRAAAAFDAAQPFRIERVPGKMLLPTPSLRRQIDTLAASCRRVACRAAGPRLASRCDRTLARQLPYGLVLHGAEVTVPAHLPGLSAALARTVGGAALIIAAGRYPEAEATRVTPRMPEVVVIPPGVDGTRRFHPLSADDRALRPVAAFRPSPMVVWWSR